MQCGFCTPGLIVSVHDLLESNPDPTDLEVREAMSGNLCRCTGYGRIFEAVRTSVARRHASWARHDASAPTSQLAGGVQLADRVQP